MVCCIFIFVRRDKPSLFKNDDGYIRMVESFLILCSENRQYFRRGEKIFARKCNLPRFTENVMVINANCEPIFKCNTHLVKKNVIEIYGVMSPYVMSHVDI